MKSSVLTAVSSCVICWGAVFAQTPQAPFEHTGDPPPLTELDALVFGKLRQRGIEPAPPCSDAVFVRRAYLDVIGTLPTAAEARAFLADTHPRKRPLLIDQLLQRDEFADYWAMKWCDVLRVKAEFPINLWPNAVQAYHRWVRTAIKDNMPYDRFARELLTASGSNFRQPPVNFYRAMQSREPRPIAAAVAQTFMGARINQWPEQRQEEMAAFFSGIRYKNTAEWKEEIVLFDAYDISEPQQLTLPDGTRTRLLPGKDARQLFADWLVSPHNASFARNHVNRIWCWLLGRGIIHEPDDIRPDNPPSNPRLLDYLEKQFIAARFDTRHIYRLILNSRTYQLSCIARSEHPQAAALFAHYPLTRLDAEVLIDALCQISGTTEEYASLIPEPFTFVPAQQRSIALADGSITSSFLEMFGRPSRDTGLFAERNSRPMADQRLHLLNSSHIRRKIEQGGNFQRIFREAARDPRAAVDEIYLTVLSRYPTEQELAVIRDYARGEQTNRVNSLVDLAWALINSVEFQYRH